MLFFYEEKKTETVVPLPFGGEMIENVLTASSVIFLKAHTVQSS